MPYIKNLTNTKIKIKQLFFFKKKKKKNLIQFLDNFNPHRSSSPNDGLTNTLQRHVLTVRIRLLHFRYLVNMFQRHRRRRHVPGSAATRLNTRRLFQVPSNRRRLDGELERVVFESRNRDGHRRLWLVLLRAGIEVLAECHQIEPVLT